MAKKLNAPYTLSDRAREALYEGDLDAASRAKTVGGGYSRLKRTGAQVNTVEDAVRVSRGLSDVNKKLRAARRPRGV